MRRVCSIVLCLFAFTGCATSDLVALDGEYRIFKEGGTCLSWEFQTSITKS